MALAAILAAAFAGTAGVLWPAFASGARAAGALDAKARNVLENAGFQVRSVPLDAIEAAGGSLRCCVGEIF